MSMIYTLSGTETNQEGRMAGLEAPCWTCGSKHHLISKKLWPREPNRVFVARGYIPCSLRSQDHFKDHYSVWWAAAAKVKSPCVPTIHKPVSAQQEGTVQNGVAVIPGKGETGSGGEGTGSGCVSLGSTAGAHKRSTSWLAKTNRVWNSWGSSHQGTAEPPQSSSLPTDCRRKSDTRSCGFLLSSTQLALPMTHGPWRARLYVPSAIEPNLYTATTISTTFSFWEV